MCTSLPLHPKKVKRWLLPASTTQTFHRSSCFIGHCTHCTLYYLFIVLKCKCDPVSPLSWCWTPTTKGILWCCARRIAALYGLQVVLLLPRRLDSVLSTTLPGRRGKSDLAAAEKSSCLLEQIQSRSLLQGETGVTPCGAGWRRLDSTGDTILVTISS